MKTQEEKLKEKDLKIVSGGTTLANSNPKGFKEGDSVYFYYDHLGDWMWGFFVSYDGRYKVRWNETNIMCAGLVTPLPAGETSVSEQYIK